MRRLFARKLFVGAMALTFLATESGCALTRLVDHLFFTVRSRRKPVFQKRVATGLFFLPIAIVLDIGTFPLQALILVIGGDDLLYPNTGADAYEFALQEELGRQNPGMTDEEREVLAKDLAQMVASLSLEERTRVVVGIGLDHKAVKVPVTPEQLARLEERAQETRAWAAVEPRQCQERPVLVSYLP